ncbi:dihydrofolate reductase family protein [Nocardia sp. NPDC050175]|uniref:dihydrofolate reductase family protein n=1 Tax=Nocardia sp. NPDC050175 TaxID=3364317 RepID=UPI003788CA62
MGKIIVTENISLDGVVQDPTGEDGLEYGGWADQISDNDRREWAETLLAEALSAEALLLGRRSDEWFATRWTTRTGEWADRLNSLPKYIVSTTLAAPNWTNATILKGEVAEEISKLKQNLSGEIVVYASQQLVRTLMNHDLIDELRLIVYPTIVGTGNRLFDEIDNRKPLRRTNARTIGDSLALLTYKTVRTG